MKLLLVAINAKYIHSNPAVYDLMAYAHEYADEIEIAEYTINHYPDMILQDIYKRSPDVVAFSCYIWNMEMVRRVLADLPQILPDVPVWVGGPEVSYDAEAFLQANPFVKGVMVGEGEETFLELTKYYIDLKKTDHVMGICDAGSGIQTDSKQTAVPGTLNELRQSTVPGIPNGLKQSAVPRIPNRLDQSTLPGTPNRSKQTAVPGTLADIAGLAFRDDNNNICHTAQREPMELDQIPFFYEMLWNEEQYQPVFANRIIYYESSRGCPFSCSYCLSSIDKCLRFRSTEKVLAELQFFLDRKVPQVKFVDRTFNCRHSHAMAIWQYIRDHDNGITNFHFEIAADLLRDDEIELLRSMRPGLVQLEIGVQSTNLQTIHEIDRVMDFEHVSEVVRQIQAGHNIHQHLDLIAGLPYEDFDSFVRSFNDVYALHPDQFQLGFLKVLKGSRMHLNAENYGLMYHREPVYEVLSTNWITYPELLRLKSVEEMVEVYYNSGQFAHTMRHLEKEFPDAFSMYDALAAYYEKNDLNGRSHSRMARFEILLSFIRENHQEHGYIDMEDHKDHGHIDMEEHQNHGHVDMENYQNDDGRKSDIPDRLYEELLTLDVYLRENSKSRPKWAPDMLEDKPQRTAFFAQEEEQRRYLPDYAKYNAKQMMHMTHLEHFTYDVLGDGMPKDNWILFDYEKREPLHNEAAVIHLGSL